MQRVGEESAGATFRSADGVVAIVNPGLVAQQMESAIVFGLSAALWGRIDIEGSRVKQANLERDASAPNYRVLRMAEMPHIETHIMPTTRAPSGVGEPGTPPVAPALANAPFALTGVRLRELPLRLTPAQGIA